MSQLTAILETMTPAERRRFSLVNRAIASGVLTAAERRTLIQRARSDVGFDGWCDGLSVRMVQSSLTVQSKH